jgi:hypothetical protein
MDRAGARVRTQLMVSAIRGLLMDRLTAPDPATVDAAFALLLDALLPEREPAGEVVP